MLIKFDFSSTKGVLVVKFAFATSILKMEALRMRRRFARVLHYITECREKNNANCVRKTGAVFFGSREIIRGNLTRAKSTRSIIETRSIIKPKTSCIIQNNAACFTFNNAACFTCIYPLPPYFFTD